MAKSAPFRGIRYRNYAEVLARVGEVPPERLLIHPEAGTATPDDLLNSDHTLGRPAELVGGILVEKPIDRTHTDLCRKLVGLLFDYLQENNIGVASGAQRLMMKSAKSCLLPDVTFIRFDSITDASKYDSNLVVLDDTPDLVVEVLSPDNTAKEMAIKLAEYETLGIALVWYVDPEAKTVTVYPKGKVKGMAVLTEADALDGGKVLPGFAVPVADIFVSRLPADLPKKRRKKRK